MTTTRVEQIRQRAQAAQRTFEEGRSRLLRPDGSKLFSGQEHEEQLAALRSERNRVLEDVKESALAVRQGAVSEIASLENRDPQELLAPDELERANARRSFAADAAETLAPSELAARLESVLAGGDKASIFAHWMAGERRRSRIIERRRESARRTSDNPADQSQVSTSTEVDEDLRSMHEAVDGGRTQASIDAARERLREADDISGRAELMRREQRSIYEPDYAVTGPGGAGR